jgi:hypothetical protein
MHVANRAPAAHVRPLRAENAERSTLAQRLLFDSRMNEQAHRIRSTWPLYLVIAIGGAASIATGMHAPFGWQEVRSFGGPRITLDLDRREETVPFTVRFSPKYPASDIHVFGKVDYEGAAEELRISLVEPGQSTLATQFHTIQGDGSLLFWLSAPATALRCASPGTDTCDQELAVVFGTGGTRTGTYVIDWSLQAGMYGSDEYPPADLIFEVDFERGRVDDYTYYEPLSIALDSPGDERWRIVQGLYTDFPLDRDNASHSMHVTMVGRGPYTASQLYVPLNISYAETWLPGGGTFRLAVVPDEPAGGAVAEHVVTVSGDGQLQVAVSIDEPLDCVDEIVCVRGFTITVDTESEISDFLFATLDVQAAIDGDGDSWPPNVQVALNQTPVPAQPQDD